MNWRRLRLSVHVAEIGKALERLTRRWKYNIEIYFRETKCEAVLGWNWLIFLFFNDVLSSLNRPASNYRCI
jgi:hypothetical protein